jgi:hypothetical protein
MFESASSSRALVGRSNLHPNRGFPQPPMARAFGNTRV